MKKTLFEPNIGRIKQNIEDLAQIVDQQAPGYTRRPFTKWQQKSREWLTHEMEAAGLEVYIDAASNLIGKLEGRNGLLAPIMLGSHTDSVLGGGRFDGMIGVVAGIEIVRQLKEKNLHLEHTLLVVDFTAEEASEFGISTIGSRGMVGNLTENDLNRVNDEGTTLKEAIESIGGRPSDILSDAPQAGEIALYLELHIEQGPVLEQCEKELGVVTGIVGIQRFRVKVEGVANHAGTTPMTMRKDALTAAAELVLAIEEIAQNKYGEQVVGTVGRLFNEPNGANIVPGRVTFDFEIRSLDISALNEMMEKFGAEVDRVKDKRKIGITFEQLSNAEAIQMDQEVISGIEESCQQVGSTLKLPSGAGHDGTQIAKVAPVGMIFIPSKDGKSHCADEWSEYEHVAKGMQALGNALLYFDSRLQAKSVNEISGKN